MWGIMCRLMDIWKEVSDRTWSYPQLVLIVVGHLSKLLVQVFIQTSYADDIYSWENWCFTDTFCIVESSMGKVRVRKRLFKLPKWYNSINCGWLAFYLALWYMPTKAELIVQSNSQVKQLIQLTGFWWCKHNLSQLNAVILNSTLTPTSP